MSQETSTEAKSEETSASTDAALGCVFGVKAGMTRVYTDDGDSIPVTVLDLNTETVITQVKSQSKEGYSAVQLGFKPKKQQRAKKSELNHFKKAGAPAFYHVEELRLAGDTDASIGANLSRDFLEDGAFVDVQGKTKGKGFQGVVKRWNFKGAPRSHGHSLNERKPGSIGQRTDPGRVYPGHKMAGHMGYRIQTTQNLKVVSYDKENKLLLVRGAIPGAKNWIVKITKSRKKSASKSTAK